MKMLLVSALVVCFVEIASAELREIVGPYLVCYSYVQETNGECLVLIVVNDLSCTNTFVAIVESIFLSLWLCLDWRKHSWINVCVYIRY